MKWLTTLATLLLCCVALTAQNQAEEYGKKKAERAKNRTENRADNKVDRAVDRAVDNVFNGVEDMFKKKKKKNKDTDASTDTGDTDEMSDQEAADFMSGMFGGKADVADSYTFDLNIDYDLKVTDKKGETETMQSTMQFPKDGAFLGTAMSVEGAGNFQSVMDLDRMVNIMITSEEQAMVMNMKKVFERMEKRAAKEMEEDQNVSVRKTGVTKMIAGYETHEFEIKDEEEGTTSLVYMAPDLREYLMNTSMSVLNAAQGAGGGAQMPTLPDTEGMEEGAGMMLGMISTDKKGERIEMIATEVSKTPVTINMSDYKLMSLPGM